MEASQLPAPSSYGNVWTRQLERNFYNNISQLLGNGINQPRQPQSYSFDNIDTDNEYLLALKDELCFADQIAFLANYKEGVDYVSAATVQERQTPPGILIRLASNETIEPFVTERLQEIFEVMEAYARRKMHREECLSQLFDKVLLLSSERIHGRLCSSKWKRPAHRLKRTLKDAPLYQRIEEQLLEKLVTKTKKHTQELQEVRQKLKELCSHYQALENESTATAGTDLLKEAIRQTHEISTSNGESLETNLKRMGVDKDLCEDRIVLQISKIGGYWGLCKFFTQLCRQPKSRQLFKDIRLETFPSYGCCNRFSKDRYVHAESQIILVYEKEQVKPFPRAIGASKSACFLCDLFIRLHGTFCISRSHNKLYDQWTLPDVPWMDNSQRDRFRTILEEMVWETQLLLDQKYLHNIHILRNIQSRLQLLPQNEGPETPSEGTVISGVRLQDETKTPVQVSPVPSVHLLEQSLVSATSSSTVVSASTIRSVDFPVEHLITPTSKSLHISTSRTDLYFSFADVKCGSLAVTKSDSDKGQSVDIRSLPIDQDVCFSLDDDQDEMVLRMLDGQHDLFNLTFLWT